MELEKGGGEDTVDSGFQMEDEVYGWKFHAWPFGIALAITVVLYGFVWIFVAPNPPYIDPTQLPPPPGSF